jgi:hypothetical protein
MRPIIAHEHIYFLVSLWWQYYNETHIIQTFLLLLLFQINQTITNVQNEWSGNSQFSLFEAIPYSFSEV